MKRTLAQISSLLGLEASSRDFEIRHLLTDSRSLESPADTLFFAIPGPSNDGHRYIGDLYLRGVRAFLVNRLPEHPDNFPEAVFLQVPDTIAALQRVARRPQEFEGEVLAITGSRGKTTLKEWIYQLMEPLAEVSRSPRSYNSQIGVPLSMWEINDDTRLAVIEAGISKVGEMVPLAECIRPDTVIITNIGDAHSEGFTDDSQKAAEKALLAHDAKLVIYRKDSPFVEAAIKQSAPSAASLSWSTTDHDADIFIKLRRNEKGEIDFEYSYKGLAGSISTHFKEDQDIENVGNAIAFMLHLGIAPEVIDGRFKALRKIGTRLNVSEGVNGCTLIHDSYTSDFSSLRPALQFLRRRKTPEQRSTLVLADLHHESAPAESIYPEIAKVVAMTGVNRLIGVGAAMKANEETFRKYAPEVESTFFETSVEMLDNLSTSDFDSEAILFKGSPEIGFEELERMLETRTHETVLEVNLDSLVANYNYFRRKLPHSTGMVCMVKASGYGAGSYEIAKTLQDCGAAYLAVAVLDEGIELRQRGISMPIMVMNPKVVNYKAMFANHLEPEIYSFEMLRDVIREARKLGVKKYPIHIKLDTGMHRMGFVEEELPALMDLLESTAEVSARSVFSHLATADCPDMDDYTELQLDRFARYTDYMLSRSSHPILRHVLNSAGILRYPEHHYDMARLGIGLYGANTLPPEMEEPLAVVSTLRTVIIAIREWEEGETIGYGRRGRLDRKSRIATIPIGYADGMNRHFGRGAISVKVNGKDAPTVGNICMDACMIDVTGIDCRVGDSVEIFGPQAPLQRLADTLDTIPYEVLTSISPRVRRIYYRE